MKRNEEKYHRPVTASNEKKKDDTKKKGMDYAQYKEKYGVGKRPQSGVGKNWALSDGLVLIQFLKWNILMKEYQ